MKPGDRRAAHPGVRRPLPAGAAELGELLEDLARPHHGALCSRLGELGDARGKLNIFQQWAEARLGRALRSARKTHLFSSNGWKPGDGCARCDVPGKLSIFQHGASTRSRATRWPRAQKTQEFLGIAPMRSRPPAPRTLRFFQDLALTRLGPRRPGPRRCSTHRRAYGGHHLGVQPRQRAKPSRRRPSRPMPAAGGGRRPYTRRQNVQNQIGRRAWSRRISRLAPSHRSARRVRL